MLALEGTVEFSSGITISSSFTAESAENADALENPSGDWNALVLNSAPSAISALINRRFLDCAISRTAIGSLQ